MVEESWSSKTLVIAATVGSLSSSEHGTFTSPVVGKLGARRFSSTLKEASLRDHNSRILAALYREQSKPYHPRSDMKIWPLISPAIKELGCSARTRFMNE